MNNFKPGDRVAVYCNTPLFEDGSKFKVVSVTDGGLLHLHNGYLNVTVHPKQCRKLKPKKQRRRIWHMYRKEDGAFEGSIDEKDVKCAIENCGPEYEIVEFVERRKRD